MEVIKEMEKHGDTFDKIPKSEIIDTFFLNTNKYPFVEKYSHIDSKTHTRKITKEKKNQLRKYLKE